MSDDELMPSSQRSRHCTHPSASLTRHTRPHRSGAKCCPASDILSDKLGHMPSMLSHDVAPELPNFPDTAVGLRNEHPSERGVISAD
jgi:hypothetical protein